MCPFTRSINRVPPIIVVPHVDPRGFREEVLIRFDCRSVVVDQLTFQTIRKNQKSHNRNQ